MSRNVIISLQEKNMNSPVEKIKERLSILDIVSSYISIEKAGKNYKAKCPFHNEKTPSFFISPDRGTYYCFGCGAKGDIFSFVEQFEGLDFLGALKLLAERAGIELSSYKNNNKDKIDIYYEIIEEATNFYEKMFSKNKEARSYLLNRGITDQSIKLFRIGYAPESWTTVLDYLLKKGFKKEDIEIVGLAKRKDNRFYDCFRGRIIFPICDSVGRIIAFSGRIFPDIILEVGLSKSGNSTSSKIVPAKYINSSDTPLFNKSNILFGLDKAKSSIRTRDYSIIVEGQMDLILSHQAGFTNTVAISGTSFTENITDNSFRRGLGEASELKINNFGLVRRLSSNIIFAYDGDDAGIRAVNRSAMIALSLDMQVKVAIFPKGKDPADIILEDYKKWEEIIKNKTDIISFHLGKIKENIENKESRRKYIVDKIFPFLRMINSSIKKSNYIKEIYEKTGISESAITEDYLNYEKNNFSDNFKKEKQIEIKDTNSRIDSLSKRLFSIIFWNGDNEQELDIINKIKLSFIKSIGDDEYKKMLVLYEPFAENMIFEAEKWYSGKIDLLEKDMKEIILNLEEEILNKQAYSLFIKIQDEEKSNNKDNIKEYLIAYQKIVGRIENIKNCRGK